MEPKFHTSFIPRGSVAAVTAALPRRHARFSIFFYAALIIFLTSAVVTAGVFLYKLYLEQQIASKDKELVAVRDQFEPATLEQFRKLDNRIESSKVLYKNHIAVSSIFNELERSTLQTLRFSNLTLDATDPQTIQIAMTGQATGYASVALQSDEFAKSALIKNVIFSNLDLDATGKVTFNFSGTVDRSKLLYAGKAARDAQAGTVTSIPDQSTTVIPVPTGSQTPPGGN